MRLRVLTRELASTEAELLTAVARQQPGGAVEARMRPRLVAEITAELRRNGRLPPPQKAKAKTPPKPALVSTDFNAANNADAVGHARTARRLAAPHAKARARHRGGACNGRWRRRRLRCRTASFGRRPRSTVVWRTKAEARRAAEAEQQPGGASRAPARGKA